MITMIAASSNAHKIKEIQSIMSKFGVKVVSRKEAGVPEFEIEEDGETFEENSLKKAEAIMKATGKLTVADDSGLMVDYLGGAPGVYSARYAGEHGNDAANNEKLLKALECVEPAERGAAFVSVACCVYPDGRKLISRGECRGTIGFEEIGDGGFGYDPLFLPEEYGGKKTMAQLTAEEKDAISHRGKSVRILAEKIGEGR